MTLRNKLLAFANNLATVSDAVYHYTRPPKQAAPFIVWAEDSEDQPFNASNQKAEQVLHGAIDLYTKTEFDPLCDAIQSALLNLDGCGWKLRAVMYEEETALIHYNWEWWY